MQYPWDEDMVKIRRNRGLRRRRLLQFHLKVSDRILDLGCGDGLDIEILRRLGHTHIVGVDISPKLVREAEIRNPGVRVVSASAEKLPFRNNSFDIVLADSVMYRIGNKNVIREIHRVLMSKGTLCIIDMHDSLVRRVFNTVTLSSFAIGYLKLRQSAYRAEQEAIDGWNESSFLRKLEKTGFCKVFVKTDLLSLIACYQKVS